MPNLIKYRHVFYQSGISIDKIRVLIPNIAIDNPMVNLIYLHATVIDTSLSSLLNISYNRLMPMYLPISTLSDLNPQSLEEFAKSQLVLGGSVTRFRDVQVRKCYC